MKHAHSAFLLQALDLAQQRRGFCAPNPSVGAVVVKDGRILAQGLHWAPGHPHAEVSALTKLSQTESQGATVYVTLEPCCHYGRTPPCTQLLIDRGVQTVYYGYQDPNPLVSGQGAQILQSAGVTSHYLPLTEIDQFYQSYRRWTLTGQPWVTAKLALSIDGKIAQHDGKPLPITGSELRIFTHQQRQKADAILTTSQTVCLDNPALNVRLSDIAIPKRLYILDRLLQTPLEAQIFNTANPVIVFHQEKVDAEKRTAFLKHGAECVPISTKCGKLSLTDVLTHIGHDGIHDLWVEVGGRCFQALFQQKLIHRAHIYVALKALGAKAYPAFEDPIHLSENARQVSWKAMGCDVRCELDYL